VITFTAAFASAALVLSAAYVGGRAFRKAPMLPVADTFRAFGVAAIPAASIDVATHRRVPGGHRGEGRATRGEARARLVPNGIHRSSVAWAELDRQRVRFSTLVRGGAR
jgi:hypothetical protein